MQEDWKEHQVMAKQLDEVKNEDPMKKVKRQQNYQEAMNEQAEGRAQQIREQEDKEWESMKSAAKRECKEMRDRVVQKKQPQDVDMIMMLDNPETEERIQAVQEVWDWREIEAAVDTACVDNVVNPKDFPGIELIETEESKRGDSWTAAGGSPIKKLGEMKIPWQTETGAKHGLRAKAGGVGKTLISGDRLLEAGYAVILNRRNPRLVHETTKEVIRLERRNRMFIMKMWVRVKISKNEAQPVFTRQGQK